MSGATEAIALGVLVVLVMVAVTLLLRVLRWVIRTQRIIAFRMAAGNLAGRSDARLAAISERVDGVRRGLLAGGEILGDLAEAMAAVAVLAAESRLLHGPAGTAAITGGIVEELERAGRALDMVEHGCRLVADGYVREHEPEAQTAIKRGYLNLLHAREAIDSHASAAAAMPVTIPRFLDRRSVE